MFVQSFKGINSMKLNKDKKFIRLKQKKKSIRTVKRILWNQFLIYSNLIYNFCIYKIFHSHALTD
jgi:hypothetical protein